MDFGGTIFANNFESRKSIHLQYCSQKICGGTINLLKVGATNSVAIGSGGGKAIGTVAFFKEKAFIPDHRTLANGNEPMVMGNPPFVDDVSSILGGSSHLVSGL